MVEISLSVAAMLAAVLAGGCPACGNCPVATVAIPDGGKGDRPVGSSGVKVSVGWVDEEGSPPRDSKDNGYPPSEEARSDPPRRRTSRQVVANERIGKPRNEFPAGSGWRVFESVEPVGQGRRPASSAKELGACSR